MRKLQLFHCCSYELCIKDTLADETDFQKFLYGDNKDADTNMPVAWHKNSQA